MGEVAEMILNGILCEQCGCFISCEEVGYPRLCEDCEENMGYFGCSIENIF